MRYLRIASLTAALCLAGALAQAASGAVTRTPSGHRISLMLRSAKLASAGSASSSGALLSSHGGPVLGASAPYLIYWAPPGHPISAASQALLNRYLNDVAAASVAGSTSNVYSVLAQYRTPYRQSFGSAQVTVDTSPYPANPSGCRLASGMTACVTDSELQAEIGRLIGARQLPVPSAPGAGTTPIFFVITPVDVNVCTSTSSCVSNSFCAYHDYFSYRGTSVLYASVPFSVFASSPKGCQTDGNSIYETPVGTNGDQAYNIADDLSHELSETITDPLINAWYTKNGYEVGDLCESYGATANPNKGISPLAYSPAFGNAAAGTLYDQVVNGDQYYNQTEYSNRAGGCRAGATPLTG